MFVDNTFLWGSLALIIISFEKINSHPFFYSFLYIILLVFIDDPTHHHIYYFNTNLFLFFNFIFFPCKHLSIKYNCFSNQFWFAKLMEQKLMILWVFMKIKWNPMDNFIISTCFTCFCVILAINYAKETFSKLWCHYLYLSTNDSQCMFVDVGGKLCNFFEATTQKFFHYMYLWIEMILLCNKMELIMICALLVE
jgi:hypothetical protein